MEITITRSQQREYVKSKGTRCWSCKSEDIEAGEWSGESSSQEVECKACGKRWSDCYELTGIVERA